VHLQLETSVLKKLSGCCAGPAQVQKEKRDDLLADIELLRQQYEAAAAATGRLSSAGPELAPGQLTFAKV
jgi:hypothetical protein